MPIFTTTFAPPAAVIGLALTANVSESSVDGSWEPTSEPDFVEYRVFRVVGGVRAQIATLSPNTNSSFRDYMVPLGVEVTYQVIVVDSDALESDPAEASTVMDTTRWWIVHPGAPEYTFELRYIVGASETEPVESESFRPIGRDRKLVVQGEHFGAEGELSAQVFSADAWMIPRLRTMSDLAITSSLYLKSPFGQVYGVTIGSITRDWLQAGVQRVRFPFTEIEPRIVGAVG